MLVAVVLGAVAVVTLRGGDEASPPLRRIPIDSVGEVAFVAQGGRMTYPAKSAVGQAIARGTTVVIEKVIGGGTGPATGTKATTCTPGAWHVRRMYEAVPRRGGDGPPRSAGWRLVP